MALVVLLKGINVGGYRRFRPSVLARDLSHFDVVNIGATGTFVVRKRVSRARLRDDISRRLPFDAAIVICDGRDIVRLVACEPFAAHRPSGRMVRFVSVFAKRPRHVPTPLTIPAAGPWTVRVLDCRGRFVLGLYRREMKAIGCLQRMEGILGGPAATRNWTTIQAVARVLSQGEGVVASRGR